ncbi:MAG: HIT domain-containing protein [Candidatus Neomarinimicrobiota bacterium]|nr:HIT domain-containing protein [Candidatus Neomarinimicrobiota bacterium]|tara:strand:+ start:321 stop:806 length:486 start_codon:yes stop_codon:yes gene_type:complete
MDRLWAPWRIDYIKSEKEKGCIFCDKPAEGDDRSMLILYRGENSFVIMNLYPYNNGHLMIAPYQHTDSTHELNSSSRSEIMELADQIMTIQKNIMNADGFNYGANIGYSGGAGIADHIHFHIVPRWTGDTNFMPVLGHTKVQMQGLQETYNDLRPHFDKLK